MHSRSFLALAVIAPTLALAAGCSHSSIGESTDDFTGSAALTQLAGARAKLDQRLAAAGGGYRYEVTRGSFSGYGSRTTIVFQNNAAVQRTLEALHTDFGTGQTQITDYKSEIGNEVGQNAGYAAPTPINALYDSCKNEVLTKPASHHPTLTLDAEGLLQSCTYSIPGCQDDCSQGVSISNFVSFDLAGPTNTLQTKVAAANGDYSYSVVHGSFSGFSSTTTLTFRANQPFRREFRSTQGFQNPTVLDSWTEEANQIGSHPNAEPAKALSDLYAQCVNDVLKRDLRTNRLSLQFDANGILNFCSTAPVGCQDDCSSGVSLSNVKFGQ